jgi:alkylation response protein AidB-like acyl-CoA dehydrogenase
LSYERFLDRLNPPADTAALIEKARALAPRLRSRAAEAERVRMVSAATIADIRDAGLFRLLQPNLYGGFGREFADYILVAEELGAGCPSSSWILANVVLKSWMVPMFPAAAQNDVWGDDRNTLVSSILRPTGRSVPVEGGDRLTGSWAYVSGVDHTQWTIIGSIRQPGVKGGPPQPVVHLVPADDYELEDDWHVVGLAATGSKSIRIEDAFVPEHRTITIAQAQSGDPPGAAAHSGHPIYRVPLMSAFGFFVCAPVMGMARGVVELFLERARSRATLGAAAGGGGATLVDLPTIQLRVAEAEMRVEAARAVTLDAAMATIAEACSEGGVSTDRRIANRRAQAYSARISVEAIDGLFEALGAGGLFQSEEIQRYWRDAHAAAAHFGQNWDAIRVMCGQYAVGLEPELKYY